MIKIEKTSVYGFEEAVRGMRNPMNSWDKSDSGICKGGDDGIGCSNCEHTYDHSFQIGKNDFELMTKLRNAGTDHRKFMRMIAVYVDITAPLYWWKEFDTYKVGTVTNSCSTMHKIAEKPFTIEDFSCEHLLDTEASRVMINNQVPSMFGQCQEFETTHKRFLQNIADLLNFYRSAYLQTKDKVYWWQMIQLLPSSYNQKRTIMMNYEVLANIYGSRKDHRLDEWHTLCDWIEDLPWSEIITIDRA